MCDIGQKNANNPTAASFPLTESINKGEAALELDNWKQLVDDIVAKQWDPLLLLTGTEPFLYPHVTELINYIVTHNLRLHITTNGTLLSRYAERLVDLCTKPGSLTLTISLDGIGEVHDSIRGVKGTFGRAINGLQAVAERKKMLGSKWPEVSICYTISNFNDHHISEFVDWFYHKDLGLKGITFSHLWFKDKTIVKKHNQKHGKEYSVQQANLAGLDIAAIDMDSVLEQLRTARESYKDLPCALFEHPQLTVEESKKYYTQPTEVVFYEKCLAPWRNVAVNPQGEVIISPLCFDYPLGNIIEQSFPQIWNGIPIKRFRRRLKKVGMYPACTRCCMLFDSKPKFYKLKGRH
jgi:MoaA/NifB/PqqE/SkfB family radical SAM enzyme